MNTSFLQLVQLNASVVNIESVLTQRDTLVNASFTSVNNRLSQLNTSVNASFLNVVTSLSQLNTSVVSTNTLVNTSFTSVTTNLTQLTTTVGNIGMGLSQLMLSTNASFVAINADLSLTNTSLQNVSSQLYQSLFNVSKRITDQNAIKLVCNDISCNQIFCTQVFTTSDVEKKTDIVPCDLGIDFLNTLRPVSFRYKNNPDKTFYGFVAQEVKEALVKDDKVPEQYGLWNEEQQTQYLSLQELISPLVKSLQEVHARLRQMEERLG
jgi:hypothetical protein